MSVDAYQKFLRRSLDPEVRNRCIEYLTEQLKHSLSRQDRVLICFPDESEGSLGWMMEQAVARCEAVPVLWGTDHRWFSLLRKAFMTKASVIICAPLLALGLTKLMKAYATPLRIRRVITAGYTCWEWLSSGIAQGFDCQVESFCGIGLTGAVTGFTSGNCQDIRLWDGEYGVEILDDQGRSLPEGERGQIILYPKDRPDIRCNSGICGYLETTGDGVLLRDCVPGEAADPYLQRLTQELYKWTSILDCKLLRGEMGLEMELVIFSGEKLPQLPSVARQIVHPLDPEHAEPFWYESGGNYLEKWLKTH